LLVVEEELLTGRKNEVVSTVHAFENFVDELHPLSSPLPEAPTQSRVQHHNARNPQRLSF
jgi:hypothetical protein